MNSNTTRATAAGRRPSGRSFATGARLGPRPARRGALTRAQTCRTRGTRSRTGGGGWMGACMSMWVFFFSLPLSLFLFFFFICPFESHPMVGCCLVMLCCAERRGLVSGDFAASWMQSIRFWCIRIVLKTDKWLTIVKRKTVGPGREDPEPG